MVICSICNCDLENIQEHMLICENKYISKEYEDLIPCEICNNLVNFDDYNEHISNCRNPIMNLFNAEININNLETQNNGLNLVNLLTNIQNSSNINIDFSNNPLLNFNIIPNQNSQNNNDNNNDNDNENENENDNENGNDNLGISNQNNDGFNLEENITFNNDLERFAFVNLLRDGLLQFENNNDNNQNNLNNDEYEELTNISNDIGNVNIRVKNKEKFLKKKTDKIIKCPICISDVNTYYETTCNHNFCCECINEWLDSNNHCPLCNLEFIEN